LIRVYQPPSTLGDTLSPLAEKLRDDFEIVLRENEPLHFGFGSLNCPRITEDVAKIVRMNVAHSVSMDFYTRRV
jgi:hypothetical protein